MNTPIPSRFNYGGFAIGLGVGVALWASLGAALGIPMGIGLAVVFGLRAPRNC